MRRLSRLSIHGRLLLVALLPAALIGVLVTALVLYRGAQALDDALRERANAIATSLAPAAEYGVISGNRASLDVLVRAVKLLRDVSGVAIYNDQGELLASGGRFGVVELLRLRAVDRTTVLEVTNGTLAVLAPVFPGSFPIDDVLQADAEAHHVRIAQPAGWICVELDARPAAREKGWIMAATLALVLAGLATAALLAVRLAHSVSQPVARLVTGVKQMAAGALDVQLPEQATNAELAALEQGFNAMARAISDIHRTMQARIDAATNQLAHLAHHDPLTGLPNRRVFEQRLEESVAASRRAGDQGALCFVDLDRFKNVNDSCGHAAGDELLREIARTIRQRLREQDIVCRIGGDEFALILRGCTRQDALRIAENLREALAAFRFSWDGRHFSIGASIGMTRIDGRDASASEILMAADLACYAAKRSGRNRVVEHAPGQSMSADGMAGGAPGQASACGESELHIELHAQAIVPLTASCESGWLEVLLRVRDEHGDLQAPAPYLSHVEHIGTGLELDLQVAARACAKLAALQLERGAGKPLTLSLNVSRVSVIESEAFVGRVHALLNEHRLAAQQLVLELPTELVEQLPAEAGRMAERVRAIGCRLALQHLDGGGIRHLATLRPDCVKISLHTFIAAFGLEAGCKLAQALAGMASALGITTVASEVEDPMLLDTLHAYGFDLVQGFAVAMPEPLAHWQAPHPIRPAAAPHPAC